jgi:hypothetical protein
MTLVGGCTLFNSFWAAVQRGALGRQIREASIEPPIFLVGHWRTGTTLLHELLTLDEQFAYPSNFECFVPSHFLVTRRFFAPLMGALLPKKRPMDDMALGPHAPQEDEFAVCALGGPTPYWRVAFPNRGPVDQDLLNLDTAPPERTERFRQALEYFFRALTCRHGRKPLVLKSPPHTGRIRRLAQWFPGARFVHIAREPRQVVRSTLKLWSAIDRFQGFQPPRYSRAQLLDFVLDSYRRMYQGYFQQRPSLSPHQLIEIRFEELTDDPLRVITRIYEQLQLPGFSRVAERLAAEAQARRNHPRDTAAIDDQLAAWVDEHWSEYRQQFGY